MSEGLKEEIGAGDRGWARDDVFYSHGSHILI